MVGAFDADTAAGSPQLLARVYPVSSSKSTTVPMRRHSAIFSPRGHRRLRASRVVPAWRAAFQSSSPARNAGNVAISRSRFRDTRKLRPA